jgi:uncharacterized heparinase superfamily protein
MDDRLVRPKSENLAERSWRFVAERLSAIGYGTPLYSVRLKGHFPLKLLASPNDPWIGERTVGADILADNFIHAGHHLTAGPGDLWEKANDAPASFTRWLQGYAWLRDLAALRDSGGKKAARQTGQRAEEIVSAWLERYGGWHRTAWRPDILGQRLMMWILHAPLILSSSDMVYRSAVLNSLVRQSRHLNRSIAFTAPGPGRITAAVGLIISGLLIAGGERRAKRGFAVLRRTLEKQILPDGGPPSRNPADAVRIACDLVILKNACNMISATQPDWLQLALDRLIPFIRALSHKDHRLAQFNGAFAGDCPDVDDLSAKSGARGKAIASASHTGYQRLKRWRTLVLVDAGPPPARMLQSGHHAGTGSLEFSDGKDRVVVNMGGSDPGYGDDPDGLLELSRSSAAHSTLIIDNTNSSELKPRGRIGRGPVLVSVDRRESEDGQWLEVSHDGYAARWGITHRRRLFLASSGEDLRGEDAIIAQRLGIKRALAGQWPKSADIRFHLHPRVSASLTQDGSAIILRLPHGHGWLFRCKGAAATLADSLYLEGSDRPIKTQQIVLSTGVEAPLEASETIINWTFRRLDSHN